MTEQAGRPAARVAKRVWIVVVVLLLCQAAACFAAGRKSLGGNVDLRAFYAAGAIVRGGQGARLYDYDYQQQMQAALVGPRDAALPFLYPPFAVLPFVALSVVSYRAAFLMLLGVNVGLLFLAALLLRRWVPYFCERWLVTLVAFYGCLFGVSVALMQGQISFALLAIYCGAWALMRKGYGVLGGAVLSLGLMKFQLAIPIFLLYCFWRQWRVAGGFLAGSAGLAAISLAVTGWAGAVAYAQSIVGMTRQTALNPAAARAHYGMFPVDMPNLHGLTFGLSHGAAWGLVLNVVLSCAVLVFAARQRASLLVALPAAMLVSYHMQPHDLTLLLLPLSFVVGELLGRAEGAGRAALRPDQKAMLAALPLLVLPLAFVVMAGGVNYVVSLAVCAVMVSAAKVDVARRAV